MRLYYKDLKNICKKKTDWNDYVGLLLGYSIESRNFFINEIMLSGNETPTNKSKWKAINFLRNVIKAPIKYAENAYNRSGVADWNDLTSTGFRGTGYISYPEEVRSIVDGKITKQQVIDGINSRRLVITEFPILKRVGNSREEYYFDLDDTKLKLVRLPLKDKIKLNYILQNIPNEKLRRNS